MKKNNYKLKGYLSNNRSKSNLKAHIILVSKYRHKLFNDPIKENTKNIIQEIANKSDFEIIEMETDFKWFFYSFFRLHHRTKVRCFSLVYDK